MRPSFSEESSCSEWERSREPPSAAWLSPEELSEWSEEEDSPGRCSSAPPERDSRQHHHVLRGGPLFRTVSWWTHQGWARADHRTHRDSEWGGETATPTRLYAKGGFSSQYDPCSIREG